MKTISILLLSLLPVLNLSAEEEANLPAGEGSGMGITLAADVVNQYIWRGQDLGNTSLQPTLGVEWKGLSLSGWGSVGITNAADDKELDLTLSYTFKGLTVGVTDYWFSKGSYFQYKDGSTTHIFEAGIGYDFGFLSASWYTNFAGDDGTKANGKRAYSSYFELTAPFTLGGLDWEGTIGAVPWETSSYGANGFCVTNVSLKATKDFVVSDKLHLPVFAGLTANPRSEKMYLIFGLSLSL